MNSVLKNKNKSLVIILLLGFILLGLSFYLKNPHCIEDVVRRCLTYENVEKGVYPIDSVKWCSFPISFYLDKGGVPFGIQDVTHPSVTLKEVDSLNIEFWIATTPYPQSLPQTGEPYENPCIYYSCSNVSGIPIDFSPISCNPVLLNNGAKYNSDPDLLYSQHDSLFYLITRKRKGEDYITKIVAQSSVNGEEWTPPFDLIISDKLELCPCLVQLSDSLYRIYTFNPDNNTYHTLNCIDYWESNSVIRHPFDYKGSIPWNKGINVWHGDIVKHNNCFYMVFCGTNENFRNLLGQPDLSRYLWLAESKDGLNFHVYQRPVLKMNGVYRSTFTVINDDHIVVYFSVHNRFRKDKKNYPAGNRIGVISFSLSDFMANNN